MPASDVRIFDGTSWVSIKGPKGDTGAPGTPATVTIQGVTALAAGAAPTVTDSNPDPSIASLTFGIPAGAPGAAATIAIGTVQSGTNAAVTNSGSATAATLNFTLPKGDKGDAGSGVTIKGTLTGTATPLPAGPVSGDMWILGSPVPSAAPGTPATAGDGIVWNGTAWQNVGPIRGPQGLKGDTGATGTSTTVEVGSTTTGAAGSSAAVVDGLPGDPNKVLLNFTIPQGLKGDPGRNAEVYNQVATPTPLGQGAIWIVP